MLALAICTASSSADAFLLLGKSKKVAHPATRVIVVREGDKTLLAVQPRYVGPAETVALLVPVSKALGEIATLSPAQVERLDAISGPRLAELWEQDPCELHIEQLDLGADPPKGGAPLAVAAAPDVTWKKQTLDGKTGAEMVAAIEKAGFVVPDGAAAALDAYVATGGGFVLATLDAADGGESGAFLPPLRVEYEAKDFSLATRLAAIRGAHDFTAFVLSPDGRFEATGQPNQGLPTNLDVVSTTRSQLPAFHGLLADFVFSKKPDALVTEYAWTASTCETCTAPLAASELAAWGTALLPSAKAGTQSEVLVDAADVSAEPDGPADLRQRLATCYGSALAGNSGLAGVVTVDVKTGATGEVTAADAKGDADAALRTCATDNLKGARLGKNGASGAMKLTFSPIARDYLASYVLTRLHARYAKAPEKDITLRRGSPLEGGRELGPEPNEAAPTRAYASETTDNYQSRYVVRHPWAGKIDCTTPKRGVWGADPAVGANDPATSTSGSTAPGAGTGASAHAPPKKTKGNEEGDKSEAKPPAVVAWLASGMAPDLQPFAIDLPAATLKPPAPKPATSLPAPPAPASSSPAAPPAGGGCGCSLPRDVAPAGLAGALVALAALFARRRLR